MEEAIGLLKKRLHDFIALQTSDVYAVSCRLRLEEEAHLAATMEEGPGILLENFSPRVPVHFD
jgi:hypothetical protein